MVINDPYSMSTPKEESYDILITMFLTYPPPRPIFAPQVQLKV